MTKKVYELAKELNVQSKDLVGKAKELGLEVKSHMSNLDESGVKKLEKAVLEDKSVQANPPQEKGNKQKAKVTPLINKKNENRPKPPKGKPIVPKNFDDRPKKADKEAEDIKPEKNVKAEETTENKINNIETKKETTAAAEIKPVKTEAAEAATTPDVTETKDLNKADAPKAEPKKEEYVNAPNKPMRFKKIFDIKTAPKPEPKKEKPKTESRTSSNSQRRDKSKPYNKNDRHDNTSSRSTSNSSRSSNSSSSSRPTSNSSRPNNSSSSRPTSNSSSSSTNSKDKNYHSRKDSNSVSDTKITATGKSKKTFTKDKDKNKYSKAKDKGNHKKYFAERSLEKKTRHKHKSRPKPVEPEIIIEEALPEGTIKVTAPITVAGLSEQAEISTSKLILSLMKIGVMANINQSLDKDTIEILAEDLHVNIIVTEETEKQVEEGLETFKDIEKDLIKRAPIITVMGHVDHGKTSLLDAIRKTNVTSRESGGITQHIGASEVTIKGKKIVFLDTPGHEAFTAMRARGAQVTDIAVLVVAADDSVKPQTIESISHAKAAGVPIIVAINKMDKPGANPDLVKKDLSDNGVLVEDWGGDVISVPVSAKKGEGITELLEMILLEADVLELKANPERLAMGTVIEARLDKAKGPIASLLVTNGTLNSGESIVAGTCSGKIRKMTNHLGETIKKAGPSTAIEVLGLSDVPMAGDTFNAVLDDKVAREIAGNRKNKIREEVLARNSSTTLEKLFSQIQEGETKELNLIVKGDVQGSVGAIISSLEKLDNENVKVKIIHSGVGTVTESDVTLADTSKAILIGFNVRPSTAVANQAKDADVEIRTYRVIYDIIDDIQNAMNGMLDPVYEEVIIGKVEIRNTFKVPGVGIIGGAYVIEGKAQRKCEVRLLRDGIVIHEGKISSLKRFKDDAKEVASNYECGIGLENYNDIKIGDIVECFNMVEIKK